jgi:hypothetical protein
MTDASTHRKSSPGPSTDRRRDVTVVLGAACCVTHYPAPSCGSVVDDRDIHCVVDGDNPAGRPAPALSSSSSSSPPCQVTSFDFGSSSLLLRQPAIRELDWDRSIPESHRTFEISLEPPPRVIAPPWSFVSSLIGIIVQGEPKKRRTLWRLPAAAATQMLRLL